MTAIRADASGDEPTTHAVHAAAFPTVLEARLVDAPRGGAAADAAP